MTATTEAPIPLVELGGSWDDGPARQAVVDTLRTACETIGFLVITDHGIDRSLIDGIGQASDGFFAPNIWPAEPPGFFEAFTAYYAAMEDLSGHLMRLMALALDLPADWFDDKIADHITNLTVNHYAALDHPPAPGQLRRGAHSDWGSLTILHHDGRPGLQVHRDGQWLDVPIVPDSFVVNLGDLMARWTNDRWVSTLHRVVVPADDTEARTSIAFFHQPTYDAHIECIPTCATPDQPARYPVTTSGEWILSMFDKTMHGTTQ